MPRSTARTPLAFEPKLDGWRGCLHVTRGVLHSRSETDLSRRFPEILQAAQRQLGDVVLDGELVALRGGRLDFAALQSAPSRRTAEGITIHFMAFDLLATDDRDLRKQPYRARRELLEQVLASTRGPIALTPATADRQAALAWLNPDFAAVGIEGIVAKHADGRYLGDRRDWIKVRHQERVDAVVIGVTGTVGHPDSLVLAQSDGHGRLRAVGLSLPLSRTTRADLAGRLVPVTGAERTALPGPVGGLPGQPAAMYLPVHPKVVVEVEADPNVEFGRFRHRPKVLRVRALCPRTAAQPHSRGRAAESTSGLPRVRGKRRRAGTNATGVGPPAPPRVSADGGASRHQRAASPLVRPSGHS